MVLIAAFLLRKPRLHRDERGATAIETAIVLPIFLALVVGTFDMGYLMYNRAMLNGLLAEAARDSTIESNIGEAADNVDQKVRDMLLIGASDAQIDFRRENFADFTSAAEPEPYVDVNRNQVCDNGEAFEDWNENGIQDSGGLSGTGGAKDVVVYKVKLTYPRLMPMATMFGMSKNVTLSAQTVVANQPFAAQQQRDMTMGNCP